MCESFGWHELVQQDHHHKHKKIITKAIKVVVYRINQQLKLTEKSTR